ncbi:hypothetical protein PYW07_006693 [Mythimna separata]|uniref:Uncharacterized protein n=1 Tax=Mythimna separata TaxID=271217 RepID=A0AAD7YU24_MYTSE|nr:hypothetical protein PYW07_006693 [Mythimna separata]
MGPEEWKKLCDKVKSIEESYIKSDHIVDVLTEELIIRVGESGESEDSTDVDFPESSEDEDFNMEPGPSSTIPSSSMIEGIMELENSDSD